MSEKGATRLDKAAHMVMDFNPYGGSVGFRFGGYVAFYHEDRLYSVRCAASGMVYLVYADNPHQAANAVMKNKTN